MPYITETEYSNIQKQLRDREELLEASKRALDALESQAIYEDRQKQLKQAITKAEI